MEAGSSTLLWLPWERRTASINHTSANGSFKRALSSDQTSAVPCVLLQARLSHLRALERPCLRCVSPRLREESSAEA